MTTKTARGRITGRIGLTLEAQEALAVGDPVHLTGPYECEKADGTKPVVGIVTVANTKRTSTINSTTYPAADVPGDVSVDTRGFAVWTLPAAGALTAAGQEVGIDVNGRVAAAGAGVATIGLLLSSAGAQDDLVDVLAQ